MVTMALRWHCCHIILQEFPASHLLKGVTIRRGHWHWRLLLGLMRGELLIFSSTCQLTDVIVDHEHSLQVAKDSCQ